MKIEPNTTKLEKLRLICFRLIRAAHNVARRRRRVRTRKARESWLEKLKLFGLMTLVAIAALRQR